MDQPQKEALQWDQIKDEESQPQQPEQRHYTSNKPKPKMQSRGEIERLIDECPDEEILLNIVKCHFDATIEEVKLAFPNFEFLKVENYNPGSFSLLFKNKEQAKEFLFTTKETKIKDRGFWIKFPPRFQKSSQKLPDNVNKQNPLPATGNKYQDAPQKNKDQYNRKEHDGKQFNRSDGQKNYKKKDEEDDGWETVMPHRMPKQFKPYRKPQQQQQQQQQQGVKKN
ncbi:unnamed protein product [Paramecium pentaurelia]|uniref:Uncharacterized protein n=1 Tax=Paramecium pentaurelia TaxID=43138 RepID=A0A8S1UTM3_9CILI|nr:unnamed protein product [Paramecium pentaurelia]